MKKTIIYFWIVLISIMLVRVPLISIPFFNVDEGSSVVIGNTVLNGGIMYRDATDGRGPVTYFLYAAISFLSGKNNMTAVHAGLACLIILEAFVLYLISGLIYGKKSILWTAVCLGLFSYTPGFRDKLAFHGEWASIVFTSLGGYFFLKYIFKNKYLFLFISGLSFGLAFFAKQLSMLDYAATLLFCSGFVYLTKKDTSVLAKSLLSSFLGFLTVALVFVCYFYANHALSDFIFYFWGYYSHYYVPALSIMERIRIAGSGYVPAFTGFFALLIFFVNYRMTDSHKNKTRELFIDLYVLSWFIFS
ncbi:MAG: glycosyltransferase family 39 protein, partial [Candidatus Omnitrophica bacterium]|nr:glycosyltransferase family 39 protein [Candidatus Omnitrophota bacterium]